MTHQFRLLSNRPIHSSSLHSEDTSIQIWSPELCRKRKSQKSHRVTWVTASNNSNRRRGILIYSTSGTLRHELLTKHRSWSRAASTHLLYMYAWSICLTTQTHRKLRMIRYRQASEFKFNARSWIFPNAFADSNFLSSPTTIELHVAVLGLGRGLIRS